MIVLRLRADTEQVMIDACPKSFRYTDENGSKQWRMKGDGFDIAVIGQMATANAVIDPDTLEIITPPVVDTRFHMNVVCQNNPGIDASVILDPQPETPRHSFMGIVE